MLMWGLSKMHRRVYTTNQKTKIKTRHKNKQEGLMQLLEGLGLLSLLTPVAGGEVSHVLLPSTLVGMLHRDYPREFRLRFGADIE